jgi:hypothetical protein
VEHVARMRDMRSAYKVMIGIPEVKIPLRVHRHRSENDIK